MINEFINHHSSLVSDPHHFLQSYCGLPNTSVASTLLLAFIKNKWYGTINVFHLVSFH